MITIQRTVDIPADRRLLLELPQAVPSGRVNVCLVFDTSEVQAESAAQNPPDAASRLLSQKFPNFPDFPSIEELKAEGLRKAEERESIIKTTGIDPLQKFCGCLGEVFDEDGVAIQRSMRDEWPD